MSFFKLVLIPTFLSLAFSLLCNDYGIICAFPQEDLQVHFDTLSAGQTLLLRHGVYQNNENYDFSGNSGNSTHKITISVYPGETSKIISNCSVSNNLFGVAIQYLTIQSGDGTLIIENSCGGTNAFRVNTGSRNFELKGPRTSIISDQNDIRVQCNGEDDCDGFLFSDLTFKKLTDSDTYSIRFRMLGVDSNRVMGDPRVNIINNYFGGNFYNERKLYLLGDLCDVLVSGNQFLNYDNIGIQYAAGSVSYGAKNVLIQNNYFSTENYGRTPSNAIRWLVDGANSTNIVIQNNLFVFGENPYNGPVFRLSGELFIFNIYIQNNLFVSDNDITTASTFVTQRAMIRNGFFRFNRQSGFLPSVESDDLAYWKNYSNTFNESYYNIFRNYGKKPLPFYYPRNDLLGNCTLFSPQYDFFMKRRDLINFVQGPIEAQNFNSDDCPFNLIGENCSKCENAYDPLVPSFGVCSKCLYGYDLNTNCTSCENSLYSEILNCVMCSNTNFDFYFGCEQCIGSRENYNYSSGCDECLDYFDIANNCSDCLNNFNISTNCQICEENYDIATLCTDCIYNYEILSNCRVCRENYDISSDCTECIGNYDVSTDCVNCSLNYDILSECNSCVNNYNLSSDCMLCNENYNLSTGCVECIHKYNISLDCSVCNENYNISTQCIECIDEYDVGNECKSCRNSYSIQSNCKDCNQGYDIQTDCFSCIENYDVSDLCLSCIENYDESDLCLSCVNYFNLSDNCETCLEGFDIETDCFDCLEGFIKKTEGSECTKIVVVGEIISYGGKVAIISSCAIFVVLCLIIIICSFCVLDVFVKKKKEEKRMGMGEVFELTEKKGAMIEKIERTESYQEKEDNEKKENEKKEIEKKKSDVSRKRKSQILWKRDIEESLNLKEVMAELELTEEDDKGKKKK